MTVKELRDRLADKPDDLEVFATEADEFGFVCYYPVGRILEQEVVECFGHDLRYDPLTKSPSANKTVRQQVVILD